MFSRLVACTVVALSVSVQVANADVLCETAGSVKFFRGSTCPDSHTFVDPAAFVNRPVGPKGDRGQTGPEGPVGPRGPQGAAGAPGSTGRAGTNGSAGAVGQKGERGDKGLPGAKGAKGDVGEVGNAGPKGPKGDPGGGQVGPKGPVGDKGATGAIGPRGATGPVGDKGDSLDFGNLSAYCVFVEGTPVRISVPTNFDKTQVFRPAADTVLRCPANYFVMNYILNTRANIVGSSLILQSPRIEPVVTTRALSTPNGQVSVSFSLTHTPGGWESIVFDSELMCCPFTSNLL